MLWSKGNAPPLLVGAQTWTATMEISMAIPQKDETESTSSSSYSTLGYIPKYTSSYHLTVVDTCTTVFSIALLILARNWRQPTRLSMDERIKKMGYIYWAKSLQPLFKKNEIMKFADKRIELEKKYPEWGKADAERQTLHVFTYMLILSLMNKLQSI